MRRISRSIIIGFLFTLVLSVTACSNSKQEEETTAAKGRFVETDYQFPADAGSVKALQQLQSGQIRMLTETEIWDSDDGGKTWTAVTEMDFSALGAGENYVYAGDIDSSGNIVLSLRTTASGELISKLAIVSQSGEIQSFDFEPEQDIVPEAVQYLQNGNILAANFNSDIIMIDAGSGELITRFDIDGDMPVVSSIGETIIVRTLAGVKTYDFEGTPLETDQGLAELMAPSAAETERSNLNSLTVAADQDQGVYHCDKSGLYYYALGGSISEKILDGVMYSLGNEENYLVDIVPKEDNSFLIAYTDENFESILKNYEYSAEASTLPSDELIIYSLYDNQALRQGINHYNVNHTEAYATLEIGIEGDSAVTPNDALKTLNTRILAGEGPDILFLDNMNIQVYSEQGLLSDMSGILAELTADGQLFENIAGAYEEDGAVYAIPTQFYVPLITGAENDLQPITDLSALAAQVGKLKQEHPDRNSILGLFNEKLIKELYCISSPSWMNPDGSLDQAGLTEFFQAAKQIQETEGRTAEEIKAIQEYNITGYPAHMIMEQRQQLVIGQLRDLNDFSFITSMNNQIGTVYQKAAGQSQDTFVPTGVIGISARSEHGDAAADFVKAYLGPETQGVITGWESGFPVNRTAYDQLADKYKAMGEKGEIGIGLTMADGTDLPFTISFPDDSILAEFKELIESLKEPVIMDRVIEEAVVQEGLNCLAGKISGEEAAANVVKTVSVYLAE